MAHNLSFNSLTQKWEVMTRGAAWHHKGQVTKDCKDWKETAELVGFPLVSVHQLEIYGEPVPAWGIFRDDLFLYDKAQAFICSTSETREIIQYDYMMAYLDVIMESEGAHYESAGMLNNGAQIWALVNLGVAFEIGGQGDRFENGLCFVEDRTGKVSAKCFLTSTRIVCANTLEMALRNNEGKVSVGFRHTKNLKDKMEDALDAFVGAKQNVKSLEEKLRFLSEREVTTDALARVVDKMFPAEDIKQEASVARANKIKAFVDLFEYNDNNMFPKIRGSFYNLENAVTEYVDHYAPVRRTANKLNQTDDQIRAERAMFGAGATYKENILDVILQEAQTAPMIPTRSYVDMGGNVVIEQVKERTATAGGSVLDAILDNVNN